MSPTRYLRSPSGSLGLKGLTPNVEFLCATVDNEPGQRGMARRLDGSRGSICVRSPRHPVDRHVPPRYRSGSDILPRPATKGAFRDCGSRLWGRPSLPLRCLLESIWAWDRLHGPFVRRRVESMAMARHWSGPCRRRGRLVRPENQSKRSGRRRLKDDSCLMSP
jgi:hypothetical protein